MDRIAREGVIFNHTYSANPVCVPAHAVLLTGLSSVNVRVELNADDRSEDVPDVPTFDYILKKNGYAAEYWGKWHTPYQFAKCYDNDVRIVVDIDNIPHDIRAYQDWLESKGVVKKLPGEGELFSGRNQRPYTPVELDYNYDNAGLDTDEKNETGSHAVHPVWPS